MKNQKQSVTAATVINCMMGSGPLIIPPVFFISGLGLASTFSLFIGLISLISALFVLESLSIANALTQLKNA